MGTRVVESWICDMPHGKQSVAASGHVVVTADGKATRVDLCADHRTAFDAALKPFLGAAPASATTRAAKPAKPARTATGRKAVPYRKTVARSRAAASRPGAPADPSTAELRTWAQRNGYKVGDRGRIPGSVREAYAIANG